LQKELEMTKQKLRESQLEMKKYKEFENPIE